MNYIYLCNDMEETINGGSCGRHELHGQVLVLAQLGDAAKIILRQRRIADLVNSSISYMKHIIKKRYL